MTRPTHTRATINAMESATVTQRGARKVVEATPAPATTASARSIEAPLARHLLEESGLEVPAAPEDLGILAAEQGASVVHVDDYSIGADARDQVELIDQPLLMMAGSAADTKYMSDDVFARATGTQDKRFHVIEGASHIQTYWVPEYVEDAVEQLRAFFGEHLA